VALWKEKYVDWNNPLWTKAVIELSSFICRAFISWIRKLRVTSQDKQTSMHAPRFGAQSKQSSKQPFLWGIKASVSIWWNFYDCFILYLTLMTFCKSAPETCPGLVSIWHIFWLSIHVNHFWKYSTTCRRVASNSSWGGGCCRGSGAEPPALSDFYDFSTKITHF